MRGVRRVVGHRSARPLREHARDEREAAGDQERARTRGCRCRRSCRTRRRGRRPRGSRRTTRMRSPRASAHGGETEQQDAETDEPGALGQAREEHQDPGHEEEDAPAEDVEAVGPGWWCPRSVVSATPVIASLRWPQPPLPSARHPISTSSPTAELITSERSLCMCHSALFDRWRPGNHTRCERSLLLTIGGTRCRASRPSVKKATRRRILKAARQVFVQKGFHRGEHRRRRRRLRALGRGHLHLLPEQGRADPGQHPRWRTARSPTRS